MSAEIAALAVEKGFQFLKAPVVRIALPDTPTPCSSALEAVYYPTHIDIARAARDLMAGVKTSSADPSGKFSGLTSPKEKEFLGPF